MPSNVVSTCSVSFQVPAPSRDAEKGDDSAANTASESLDIEHVYVDDDPRKWSNMRKVSRSFATIDVATGSVTAIKQVETDLRTTSGKFSLVLSIFIVFQGSAPLLWTAISEIKGRKLVYVLSLAIGMVGYIVAAEAESIGVLIGMRAIQAMGTGSVLAIGAATLADIYDPCERGSKLGIAYAAPLLGPSLGPILGGVLTQAFSWRACFWLLAAYLGASLVLFVFFFRDTFRKERSLTYQRVLARRRSAASKRSSVTSDPTPVATVAVASPQAGAEIALSFKDVNPFPPLFLVLKRRNNIATLFPSGMQINNLPFFFAFSYNITYTCSRTLGDHYNYDALKIGLVLLSFGAGSLLGSVLGGRWSDRVLRRLTSTNGGHRLPEMRLESTKPAMAFLPLSVVAYAWLAQERVHVASLCTALFFVGFFSVWIYSSTLAYIVDANPGRSSAAVAANSWFRGIAAFVFTEAVVPLQDSMGDGGLYTLWAGILVLSEVMLLLVRWRGGAWREAAEECEKPRS
ncbi:major facilitator superfamily domain-containing protein [Lactarius vividus]|nr:major facilitator superfamily domain-containing protein [Lactarius vividus]